MGYKTIRLPTFWESATRLLNPSEIVGLVDQIEAEPFLGTAFDDVDQRIRILLVDFDDRKDIAVDYVVDVDANEILLCEVHGEGRKYLRDLLNQRKLSSIRKKVRLLTTLLKFLAEES